MKHPKLFMDNLRKQFAASGLQTDPNKPPAPVKCAIGHVVRSEWVDSGEFSHWSMPDPEKCKECAKREKKALYVDLLIERFNKIGIPTQHQEFSLGWAPKQSYTQREIVGDRVEFRDVVMVDKHNQHVYRTLLNHERQQWKMFAGPVGTGKTTFATALMMDMVEEDRTKYPHSIWTTESGLFRACDVAGAKDYSQRVKQLQKYVDAGILLIDDLGASRRPLTDWQGGAMRDLFDHRHSNHKPTLLTTNISCWEDLAKRYGKHVISRMVERCETMHLLAGPDRRLH
jgi:DNA replication protein DnaC